MDEIVKHINDTNASYRNINAGDAKNTDLFLDNEHYEMFRGQGNQITVRYSKSNLTQAILFIASILPRKFDQSAIHEKISFSKEFVLDQLAILDALFSEGEYFTQKWTPRKDVPQKNGKIDTRFYFNGLLKDIQYVNIKGVVCKTKFTIRNYFAGGYSELHIRKADNGIFDINIQNVTTPFEDNKEDGLEVIDKYTKDKSLQQIYYGAPGTGKSHSINDDTKGEDVLRTTFHPDTDYATFVGAYKPTTIDEQVMAVIGTKAVPVTNEDGNKRTESKIVYEFVAQSFLNAYTQAWEKQAEAADGEVKKQYLVIEEINRGNCAQIFGDLFQLLDRNENGFSEYPITADADMKRQLQKAFNGLEVTNKDSINKDFEGRDVVSEVLNGDVLLLPNNFYIWATMNTSDQSLFPIDSAFKRRWDWQYIPINNANKGWMIEVGGKKYDWWQFLSAINAKIGSTTSSEDKKLGYFFCKANGDGVITADRFVGKVVFYIWNDVFKDYELGDAIFNDPEGGKLTFDKFYTSEGKNSNVVEDKVVAFLSNLGVQPMEDGGAEPLSDETIADNVVIKVNGQQVDKYNAIGYTAVEKYVDMNPDKTAEEIANIWDKFVSCNPTKWFIVDEAGRKELSERYQSYSYEIKCSDNKSVWVNKDGWRRATVNNSRDTVQEFIDAVNAENLSVHIEEIKQ